MTLATDPNTVPPGQAIPPAGLGVDLCSDRGGASAGGCRGGDRPRGGTPGVATVAARDGRGGRRRAPRTRARSGGAAGQTTTCGRLGGTRGAPLGPALWGAAARHGDRGSPGRIISGVPQHAKFRWINHHPVAPWPGPQRRRRRESLERRAMRGHSPTSARPGSTRNPKGTFPRTVTAPGPDGPAGSCRGPWPAAPGSTSRATATRASRHTGGPDGRRRSLRGQGRRARGRAPPTRRGRDPR